MLSPLKVVSRRFRTRYFSTSSLGSFEWTHRNQDWKYTYTLVSPDDSEAIKGTFVLFPSTTLLSSREEWRECSNFLSELGYRSILIDWPGWHHRNIPLNWAIEDDVNDKTLVSAFTHFAYSALTHVNENFPGGPLHIATSGGGTAVHIRRALAEANKDMVTNFKSLSCFSPTWRFYLTRQVPEGYPRKLARRQAIADAVLDSLFVRSKTMYRLYKSKLGLSRLTRRFYEEKIQHNPEILERKKEVITRDRPLTIDAAMIVGHLNAVKSTEELISELFGTSTETSDISNESDDDDDNLLNIKVPQWAKAEKTDGQEDADEVVSPTTTAKEHPLSIHLVIPEDALPKDKSEMALIQKWAEHENIPVASVPGKLFCHEESPALSATILHEFVSSIH